MTTRQWMAGAAAVAVLAMLGAGTVSAQPRDDRPAKSRATDDARFSDQDMDSWECPCGFEHGAGFGPGPGAGWGGPGRWGRGGPGMHRRGFGGPGAGFGGPRGPGRGGWGLGFGPGAGLLRGGGRIAKALDLTDAQIEKLRDIREDHHRTMIKARADMELARMDLSRMLEDDETTGASVERQIDAMARLHAQQMKSMAEAHRLARDVLTAKQRDRLKEMRRWGDDGEEGKGGDRPRRGSKR